MNDQRGDEYVKGGRNELSPRSETSSTNGVERAEQTAPRSEATCNVGFRERTPQRTKKGHLPPSLRPPHNGRTSASGLYMT